MPKEKDELCEVKLRGFGVLHFHSFLGGLSGKILNCVRKVKTPLISRRVRALNRNHKDKDLGACIVTEQCNDAVR